MWFKKSIVNTEQKNTDNILNSILTNGVNVSIEELLPYQSKTSLINLAANKNLHSRLSGNYLSRSKGRGMEFDEVRHYQTGDDIRAIDWRVTARTGKTHTKLFREEVERPVLIATDLTASMKFGSQLLFKSVQASHIAALVAWHGMARGDRIGGVVFNDKNHCELKPRSRKAGVLHYLHALSQIHNVVDKSLTRQSIDFLHAFEENCARLRQLARPGSLVYLITDAQQLTTESLRHLTQISQHCELIVCLVSDPLEQNLPKSKSKLNVALTDGQQRQQLLLGDVSVAKQYQQKAQQIAQEQQDLLTSAGARLVHFTASQTLELQLKNGEISWSR